MSTLLTVIAVSEVKQDKNEKNYRTIGFRTPNIKNIGGLDVRVKTKESTVTAWEESYLDNKMQFGFDFKVNDLVEGNILTKTVEPYYIVDEKTGEEKQVSTYTCVVFGDDTDSSFELEVKKAFKAAGHEIVEQVKARPAFIPIASSAVAEIV